jgi:hypothetical protein
VAWNTSSASSAWCISRRHCPEASGHYELSNRTSNEPLPWERPEERSRGLITWISRLWRWMKGLERRAERLAALLQRWRQVKVMAGAWTGSNGFCVMRPQYWSGGGRVDLRCRSLKRKPGPFTYFALAL